MTVYADVLITVNIIVDYFLIRLTAFFLKIRVGALRLLAGSFLGGVFSLYIFLPKSPVITEIGVRIIMSCLISLAVFGFKGVKPFARNTFCLFGITFVFAGLMLAVFSILKPYGMVINNSVVYFDISPVILIASSVSYYLAVMLVRQITEKNCKFSQEYILKLELFGKSIKAKALSDTGNSVKDVFGYSNIIIVDRKISKYLLDNVPEEKLNLRYRAIPCKCVSGDTVLDGYRLDSACCFLEDKPHSINNPIMAISKTKTDGDFDAVINPETIEEALI